MEENIPPKEVVGALIITDKKEELKICLVIPQVSKRGLFCLPTGHIRPDETWPEALRREVEAETGLTGLDFDEEQEPFWVYDVEEPEKGKHNILRAYIVFKKEGSKYGEIMEGEDKEEIKNAFWTGPSDALKSFGPYLDSFSRLVLEKFVKEQKASGFLEFLKKIKKFKMPFIKLLIPAG